MADEIYETINLVNEFIYTGKIDVLMTPSDEIFVHINSNKNRTLSPLYSKTVENSIRRMLFEYDNRLIKVNMDDVINYLAMLAYDNRISYDLVYRISYCEETDEYLYDLDQDTNKVLSITEGNISICESDRVVFKRSSDYKKQVIPDISADKTQFLDLIEKHFNLGTKELTKLFSLYLIAEFFPNVNTPVCWLCGEKGASKSTTLRKLQRIISPTNSDLIGMPKNIEDMAIRLNRNYFTTIDNCSKINLCMSDLLARSTTNGSMTKRKLYSDQDEQIINISSKIAINSIGEIVTQADLLDRCFIVKLPRVDKSIIKTEREIWNEFDKDLPIMMGCIFKIIAEVLTFSSDIETKEFIRLVDYHLLCLKIGLVLGLEETEVNELIWDNQKVVNQITIDEDVIATTIISLMSTRKNYVGSVSELLKDITLEARHLSINKKLIPASPNHLSSRLKKIRSNLEQEANITFNIKNVGTHKEISILKK